MIVPLVCLVLGMTMLATTAYVTLRQPAPGAPPASAVGGSFALIDEDGKAITHRDMAGKPYLVFFGFTHCPDICPTTAMEISQVFEALGKDAKVSALFITVDPERDTARCSRITCRVSTAHHRRDGPRENIDAAIKGFASTPARFRATVPTATRWTTPRSSISWTSRGGS